MDTSVKLSAILQREATFAEKEAIFTEFETFKIILIWATLKVKNLLPFVATRPLTSNQS